VLVEAFFSEENVEEYACLLLFRDAAEDSKNTQ